MYVSSGTGTVSLTTYSNNSTYNDEWKIAKIGYMSETATLEGQQTGKWCWATAARIFAKHYDTNGVWDALTQRKAVAYAYGKPDTDTSLDTLNGNSYRAQIAMNYYMEQAVVWGGNGDAELSSLVAEDKEGDVYSQNTLVQILDNNHVLYISRNQRNISAANPEWKGHSMLIYGYVIIDSTYYFLIRDPEPDNANANVGGSSYLMSYNEIYRRQYVLNGNTIQEYWFGCVVHKSVPDSIRNATIEDSPS